MAVCRKCVPGSPKSRVLCTVGVECGVFRVRDGLAPFVARLLAGALDGDVAEPAVLLRAVPVLDLGGADDHVPGPDFLDGLAPFLGQADPGGDDEHLSHRMDMPVGAGAGFKSDAAAAGAHGVIGGVQGIDAHGPGKKAAELATFKI